LKYPPTDTAEAIRQMGRDSRAKGVSIANPDTWPFMPKSRAAKLWLEGWRQGYRQMSLFEVEGV
jgi:hypothetical protein